MKNLIKNIKNSNFIGQQLSRFRMAMSYYSMAMTTLSAIMLVKTAYPSIQLEWIILAAPIPVILTLFLGYFMDKHNINTMDTLKSIEMSNRFLNLGDIKNQEFQMMQTRLLMQAFQAMKEGKDIDITSVQQTYQNYVNKWKSPYE